MRKRVVYGLSDEEIHDQSDGRAADEGFEDEVIARVDATRAVRRAMGILTPAERKAVFSMLSGRRVKGDAISQQEKDARRRAAAKLRKIMST